MKDEALSAIRKKKESSLVRAMVDLKAGEISALVTCALTGAVTAAAVVHLKRFSGLHHPALVAVLPLPSGPVIALDVGAFVVASGQDLLSYGFLGSAYAAVCHEIRAPRVGLLNIGREAGRGSLELRLADQLLSHAKLACGTYVGNVEPSDVLFGQVDVVVTAGFAGNIFLKTAEAMAKISSLNMNRKEKGALLAGVKGVVIKCHGSSSQAALKEAVRQAYEAVERSTVPELEKITSMMLLQKS
jgi:glycerol-3-phosphate acyltransferase PlsX